MGTLPNTPTTTPPPTPPPPEHHLSNPSTLPGWVDSAGGLVNPPGGLVNPPGGLIKYVFQEKNAPARDAEGTRPCFSGKDVFFRKKKRPCEGCRRHSPLLFWKMSTDQ